MLNGHSHRWHLVCRICHPCMMSHGTTFQTPVPDASYRLCPSTQWERWTIWVIPKVQRGFNSFFDSIKAAWNAMIDVWALLQIECEGGRYLLNHDTSSASGISCCRQHTLVINNVEYSNFSSQICSFNTLPPASPILCMWEHERYLIPIELLLDLLLLLSHLIETCCFIFCWVHV